MGLLSTYQVGQRSVQLFQLADGHIQWVCNCDDYAASAGFAQGAWCKHVAKASAIRSIERLTGARVVGRSRAQGHASTKAPAQAAPSPQSSSPQFVEPDQASIQPN
jgi:hypothetical protein